MSSLLSGFSCLVTWGFTIWLYDIIYYRFFLLLCSFRFRLRFIVKFLLIIVNFFCLVAVICYHLFISNSYCYIFNFLLILVLSDDELNPGPKNNSSKCRVPYLNIRGLYNNISDWLISKFRTYSTQLLNNSLTTTQSIR